MAHYAKCFTGTVILITLQSKFSHDNLHFTNEKTGSQKRLSKMPRVKTTIQWQSQAVSPSLTARPGPGWASRKHSAFVCSFAFVFKFSKHCFLTFLFTPALWLSSSLFYRDIRLVFPCFKLGTGRTLINETTDVFVIFQSVCFGQPLRKYESSFLELSLH